MDRRNFLKASSIAVGASLLPAALKAKAVGKKTEVIVGAHPWVYAATQPEYDIFPILDKIFSDMKEAKLDGIELMHTVFKHQEAVARIKELSDQHKLPVIGTSFGGPLWDGTKVNENIEHAHKVIEGLGAVGGKTLGISVGRAPVPKVPGQILSQVKVLKKICEYCTEYGIVPNLHNHTYEVEYGMHDLKGTLQHLPDFKLGPDLNWLVRAEVEPVDFIKKFGEQIVFLHLRDQHADGRWSEAMGEGDMDYKAIGKVLKEIAFSGHAIIELAHENDFTPTRPIVESLAMSRKFVKKTLGF